MKRKYPKSLFVMGFVMNLLIKFWYLFVLSLILRIIGIWIKACLYIVVILIVLDFIISLIYQMVLVNTFVNSSNLNMEEFQDAISTDNWSKSVRSIISEKIDADEENKDKD